MQNQVPKIDAATLEPVAGRPTRNWNGARPAMAICIPALVGSGWLDRLLAEGVKYAFVSNSDNLGAILDPAFCGYFADSGAPFLMEVARRTAADRKGGHLARRKATAGCCCASRPMPGGGSDAFQDIDRHRYFNTNSLWLRLDLLKDQLAADAGVLPLPMIRNHKTVDPRDKNPPPVIQLEIAMGAAIECFEVRRPSTCRAAASRRSRPPAICSRCAPMPTRCWTTARSACRPRHGEPPVIHLSDDYKLVDQSSAGRAGLVGCDSLDGERPGPFRAGRGDRRRCERSEQYRCWKPRCVCRVSTTTRPSISDARTKPAHRRCLGNLSIYGACQAGAVTKPTAAMANIGSFSFPLNGFEAVVFDCDGTLVDSMPAHFDAWCEALAIYGPAGFSRRMFFSQWADDRRWTSSWS